MLIESSSTSVFIGAGGEITLAAFGLLLTSAVLALGGIGQLIHVMNEGSHAGAAFDANPANGCPDRGGTTNTRGWYYTGATDSRRSVALVPRRRAEGVSLRPLAQHPSELFP